MIATLGTNIESSISALLTSYHKLDYVSDLEKNANFKHNNYYGVLLGEAEAVPGVVGKTTLRQTVNVIITAQFSQPNNDALKRATSNSVSDTLISVAEHLARTKCGTSGVLSTELVSISDTEVVDTVLFRTAKLTVLYRI